MTSTFDDFTHVYFQGLWLIDPKQEFEGPTDTFAFMFFDGFMMRLDVFVDDDGEEITDFESIAYVLDKDTMVVSRKDEDGDFEVETGWKIDDHGSLWFEFGGDWLRFISVGVRDLVKAGFDRKVIKGLLDTAKIGGVGFRIKPKEPLFELKEPRASPLL